MKKKKKFYKKAKPKEKKKLPKNYRFITDKFLSDHLVFFVGIFLIVMATIVVSFDLYKNYNEEKQYAMEKNSVAGNLSYWEKVTSEKPNYRDGYFSLALIYFQLKDFNKSSENLEKAMSLDPNFEKGKELKKILEDY